MNTLIAATVMLLAGSDRQIFIDPGEIAGMDGQDQSQISVDPSPGSGPIHPALPDRLEVIEDDMGANDKRVVVRPGETYQLMVPLNNTARLVTPFPDASFVSQDIGFQLTRVGHVLYVAVTQQRPVAGFITGAGDESIAVVLTPSNIPLAEYRFVYPSLRDVGTESFTERREEPYVDYQVQLLEQAVTYGLVDGFSWVPVEATRARYGPVQAELVSVQQGRGYRIERASLTNPTDFPVQLNEASFSEPGITAIALFPRTELAPYEYTYLYRVRRVDDVY